MIHRRISNEVIYINVNHQNFIIKSIKSFFTFINLAEFYWIDRILSDDINGMEK